MKEHKVLLIGAGGRSGTYIDSMDLLPGKFKMVGVADPLPARRNAVKERCNIPDEYCFEGWEDIFARPKFADIAIIATMDDLHFAPAMKAIELGYDLLLEKPISPSLEECIAIRKAAEEKGVKVMVCHVLRYTPYFTALKTIIDSGKLGKIITMNHAEEVGILHQSHSFVRGNWGNEGRSTFMLLAKSCHDMDIMQWLVGKKVTKVQSFGGLEYFTEKNAPEGAPERCLDGCPVADTCIFNAKKLYLDPKDDDWFRPAAARKLNPTDEEVEKALRETNYGKCVFKCDNDVVDHQTVNLEYEDGTTTTFTMTAFSNEITRQDIIYGTKGRLVASMYRDTMEFDNFQTGETEILNVSDYQTQEVSSGGHGGGDYGIMKALYEYKTGEITADEVSEINISVQNHLVTFAAEKSRRMGGKTVDIAEFEKEMKL